MMRNQLLHLLPISRDKVIELATATLNKLARQIPQHICNSKNKKRE